MKNAWNDAKASQYNSNATNIQFVSLFLYTTCALSRNAELRGELEAALSKLSKPDRLEEGYVLFFVV